MKPFAWRFLFAVSLIGAFLGLTACGGGGGGGTNVSNVVKLSGAVLAPQSQVALLQHHGFMYALMERLVGSADAGTVGLLPVSNATVEAVQVDNSGNVTATLGSATSDSTGHYILQLPSGTVLSPTIILRVQGSGTQLRAPAVQALVDITPTSEWLLQQLSSHGAALADLTNEDVLFLQSVVESYTIDAGGDVASTLANLDALAGVVGDEITAVKQSAGTSLPSLAGTWHLGGNDVMVGFVVGSDQSGIWLAGQWLNTLSDYTIALTASGSGYSATVSGSESEVAQFSHGSACAFQLTAPYVTGCTFASYNWSGDNTPFYAQQTVGPFNPSVQIFPLADGRIMISNPAEETIENGDIFAYVTPPFVNSFLPMGTNAYAGIAGWPTFAYALTSDGTAADRNQLRGGSADIKPMALVKQGSGLGNGTLNGNFAFVAFTHYLQSDGLRDHTATAGLATFNGDGTLGTGSNSGWDLSRTGEGNPVTLTGVTFTTAITGGSYAVTSSGALTLNLTTTNGSVAVTGQAGTGGDFFYAGSSEANTTASPENVSQTTVLGFEVAATAPALTGKDYRFQGVELEYGDGSGNAAFSRYRHIADSTLSFVDGTNVTLTVNTQEIERNSDIDGIVVAPSQFGTSIGGTYTTGTNGSVTIVLSDGSAIRGYVSATGGALLAIRGANFPAADGQLDLTSGSATLGIALGSCSSGC